MNEEANAKIEQIINEGYNFKFGDYISRGFEIVQKNFGGFIAFALLTMLISGVIGLIPFIGFIANTFFISPALTVGFYIVANKLWRNESSEFGDFFKGFDHIGQLALTALVQLVIILVAAAPFILQIWNSGLADWYWELLNDPTIAQGELPEMPPSWTFVLLLPMIYLGVSYSWSYMFVVFHKMPFWDAMESSRRIITKQWFVFFLFYIVISLIMMSGVIVLCVGLLFTLPAWYCMQYAAFEDVTRLNEEPEEGSGSGIEQHLIV